jgi:translation initiation factor IF-2
VAKKIKISDLAKELGKTSKELLVILKDLGVAAKTAASSIEDESAQVVRDLLSPKKEVPKEKPSPIPSPAPTPTPSQVSAPTPAPSTPANISIPEDGIVVKDLAVKMGLKSSDLIKELMKRGMLVNLNQKIAASVAVEIVPVFGKAVEIEVPKAAAQKEAELPQEATADMKHRPPVVTILGHVDHGKTKLLDAIRSTKVAESEAGGITQHIGAYQVEVKGKKITFLDTPGHEAFTALRARGAKVTDIAVLVVAADDGVMPQTIEAIDHARAAGVPILVALNKIDKPTANADRVKQQLSQHGLQPEDWGGQTVMVPVSAKQKQGIDELLEMILLLAEMQDLKANPKARATGIIVESKLDKSRGPVATVLIKNGTLKVGDNFVSGAAYGKVRALVNDKGSRVNQAPPSFPVEMLGASEVPKPGDILQVMESDRAAKDLAEKNRLTKVKVSGRAAQTLENFSKEVKEGVKTDLNLIIKADVEGSLEALTQNLTGLEIEGLHIHIIHSGVGNINESDVLLAEASGTILLGFHVEIDARAREIAETEEVKIRLYDIIYKLIDDVKLALTGMLEPEYEEVTVGSAEVRQTFKYSKLGVIAGCFVTSGKFVRGAGIRIFREGNKVYEGKVESLKRFKEDVKEVAEGYECGIAIPGYEDFKVGDQLNCFEMREKKRK